MSVNIAPLNKELDLVLEREVDVPLEKLWRGLTEAEQVKKWFCPKPWQVVDCRMDLRPGGEFYFVMQSPEGQQFPSSGCYLFVNPKKQIIWTAALAPGFRPALPATENDKECSALTMSCVITLEARGNNTLYNATVLHNSAEHRKQHEAMGFHVGWGICLDQLVELAKTF